MKQRNENVVQLFDYLDTIPDSEYPDPNIFMGLNW